MKEPKNIHLTTAPPLTQKPCYRSALASARGVVGFNKNCEAGDFILIGFEESQTVTKAFRDLGYNAYSCDLKPCSGGHPEWHLQSDIRQALQLRKWKFIGLHPTCTAMALSGNRHYAKGKPKHQLRVDAIEWTIGIWNESCEIADFVYMENPLGAMNGDKRLPKPQIVQPYYFGDAERKTTCLWLHGLKPLEYAIADNLFMTKTSVEPILIQTPKGDKLSKWHYDSYKLKNQDKAEMRSKTFPNIAKQMASQWGANLTAAIADEVRGAIFIKTNFR